jgi:GNAT superfamily N-acetyltransferase
MSAVLQDLSASALVSANEANLCAFHRFFHGWPRAEIYTGPDISWCITDMPSPFCNIVFRARLEWERVDNTIQTLIAKGRARNVPLRWLIGQGTSPAGLGARLEAHGFTRMNKAPGMAVDLLSMNEDVSLPSDLTITKVQDSDTLKLWCHAAITGFGLPGYEELALLDLFTDCIDLHLPLLFYLGWWRGKPVSTSLLFLAEGVAGLYFVATVPEARCQGIGRAVTLAPLQEARRAGYRAGILQASEMGARVYRKIGFQEYCKIGSYIWFDELHRPPADKKP